MAGNLTTPDLAAIVRKLTPAQRVAIRNAPSTPLGNVWLVCAGSKKSALVKMRLASGHGDWCTLNENGLAVRAHLLSETNDADR